MILRVVLVVVGVLLLLAAGVSWYFRSGHTRLTFIPPALKAQPAAVLPKAPDHVVVIVEENKALGQIAGDDARAPYLNELIARGALFTQSYGIAHPSQPNYFALFAGVVDSNGDGCPAAGISTGAPNIGAALIAAHRTFAGYAEDLPRAGFAGCRSGAYARKHAPWTLFRSIPAGDSRPFNALTSYAQLPTLAFVIPNIYNDMHSGSIERADAWLRTHVAPLAKWATHHNTLLVITWDESSAAIGNQIPTIFFGPMVRPGRYNQVVSHYDVLRTIEAFYGIRPLGASAGAAPIGAIWRSGAQAERKGSAARQ